MRTVLSCAVLAVLCLSLAAAREKDSPKGGDQEFVTKASAAGLAEVNLAALAMKQANSPKVKDFAQKMIADHGKANRELISIADRKKFKVSEKMDKKHEKLSDKLGSLSGSAFDSAYMEGQVKDHEEAVKLFEKQSKSGKDDDLKSFAGKTLPTIKQHLKMAKEIHGDFKKGSSSK